MRKITFFFLFFVLLCNSPLLLAQTEPEQIKSEEDVFQDYFFEALKQQGIENYDKAIDALEECLKTKPNEAIVYHEFGRNYLALKKYNKAFSSFEKATQIDPKNKWIWVGMYEVSYQTKNYQQAITSINKLIEFDEIYKEDLTSLYMSTLQYDKALALINELNEKIGKTDRRDSYKMLILSQGEFHNVEIENLKDQISKHPKEESNYISLIKLYSETNNPRKAIEITQKLDAEIPNSVWAQVGLFKYYLDINEPEKAIKSMDLILSSSKVDFKIKHKILNEFLIFVTINEEYEKDLDHAITYFENDSSINVAKEIGKYYHNKKKWDKAIQYYEQGLNNNNEDIETILLLLQVYADSKQFELVAKKASELIETYPTEPRFYYFLGMANNQMHYFKKAISILEPGLDYVVDNLSLEINFNIQLGEAYNGLGDFKKKEKYFSKADQLLKK